MLDAHKDDLLSRKDSRRTWKQLGRPWYALVRYGSRKYFERTKIVTDMVVNNPGFCLDEGGCLFETGATHGITPHNIDPYYLTGLLNSQVIFSYLKPICSPMDGGYTKIEGDHLKRAPIYQPEITDECSQKAAEVLEQWQGDFGELDARIKNEGVCSVISTEVDEKKMVANMLRETSKKIIDEFESLSNSDIEQLERVNDQLAGIIFELDEEEQEALSKI